MSFTLGNGWDQDFGFFSLRGRRAVGQRLHHGCKKARAYDLPEGFLPGAWKKWPFLRSVRRRREFHPSIKEARRRQFDQAMDRNPLYYVDIAKRPAGALRLGYVYEYFQQWNRQAQPEEANGPREITIELTADVARLLEELATRCTDADKDRDGFTSHGPLTVQSLVTMLAEDAAMVVSRPGSWEGANMANVFSCHGYEI